MYEAEVNHYPSDEDLYDLTEEPTRPEVRSEQQQLLSILRQGISHELAPPTDQYSKAELKTVLSDPAKAVLNKIAMQYLDLAHKRARNYFFKNQDSGLTLEDFESIAVGGLFEATIKFVCGKAQCSIKTYLRGRVDAYLLEAALAHNRWMFGSKSVYTDSREAENAEGHLRSKNGGGKPSRQEIAEETGLLLDQVHHRMTWRNRSVASLEAPAPSGAEMAIRDYVPDTDAPTPEEVLICPEVESQTQYLTPFQIQFLHTQGIRLLGSRRGGEMRDRGPISETAVAKRLGIKETHLPAIREAIRLVLDGEEPGLRDVDREKMIIQLEAELAEALVQKHPKAVDNCIEVLRRRHPYNGEAIQEYMPIAEELELNNRQAVQRLHGWVKKAIMTNKRLNELFEIIHGYLL